MPAAGGNWRQMKKILIALSLMITAALVFGESITTEFVYITEPIEVPSFAKIWFTSNGSDADNVIIQPDVLTENFELNVQPLTDVNVKLIMKPLRRDGEENGTVIPSTVTAKNIPNSNESYKLEDDLRTAEWNIEADGDKTFQYYFSISVDTEDYDSAVPDTYEAEFIAEVSEGTK